MEPQNKHASSDAHWGVLMYDSSSVVGGSERKPSVEQHASCIRGRSEPFRGLNSLDCYKER